MQVKRIILLVGLLIVMAMPICQAENWQFIDANGYTGYYVDMDTADYESVSIIDAKIAVIKANTKRKFVYDMKFNIDKNTYQIVDSAVINYETKETMEESAKLQPERKFGMNSPMKAIIDYIWADFQRQKKVPPTVG